MSRFTILGGSGYVGRHLAAHLRQAGHDVATPTRDGLTSRADLGHVIYSIGLTGNFRQRPFDTVRAHVGVLADLLETATFESFLYLSSTRVYMGAASTDEDAALHVQPNDPGYLYNLSKLTGESLCQSSPHSHVRIARLSNVVGRELPPASGNLIAQLTAEARQGHIHLQSAPESAKDYVHVEDVAHWLHQIALRGQHRVYNVASGIQTTHQQWLDALQQASGCQVSVPQAGPLQSFAPIQVQRLQAEFPRTPRSSTEWLAQEFHPDFHLTP